MLLKCKKKACIKVYSLDIPGEFSELYSLHPWYWNTLFYSLILFEKNSAIVSI